MPSKSRRRRSPFRFSRLKLRNYKNFKQVDVQLQERVFLVGPNASGKSNFLDALRLLADIASPKGGLQAAVDDARRGFSHVRSLHATRDNTVGVEVEVVSTDEPAVHWTYALELESQKKRTLVRSERVTHDGSEVVAWDATTESDPELRSQTRLEQVQSNKEFRELAAFLASVQYLHLVPQFIKNPDRLSTTPASDPFGADFIERIVKSDARTQKSNLRRIERALQLAVPQLEELRVEQDRMGVPHLIGRYKHWRKRGALQTETEFSDGTLRLIGLFWSLLQGTGPLLLEEPELSLHPGIVTQLPQLMASVMLKHDRQLIVSTHSPDLLRDEGIAPDEVLVVEPGEHGSSVRSAHDIPDLRAVMEAGITADHVLTASAPAEVRRLSDLEATR